MNCGEFKSLIDDLARDRLMEAQARESADLHAANCAACARRLADERSLASGLRLLAAVDAQREAPARVEAALMEAFRRRSRVSREASVRARRSLVFRLRWAAAAAAAAILLIVALAASRVEQTPPAGLQAKTTRPEATEKKDEKPPTEEKRERKAEPSKKKRLILLQARNPSSKRAGKKTAADPRDSKGAFDDEIATGFFPITPAGGLGQMDGGQLVRVEVPRSALVSFGLPMNMERANERIKADVLIGNDGVAHAIRFVR